MGGEKILIIDDNTTFTNILNKLLNKEGFKPITAVTCKHAVPIIERENPELIILDIQFPEENGLEFCRKIRTASKVPIIILTATKDRDSILQALESEADDYITKPYDNKLLIAKIRNTLRRFNGYKAQSFSKLNLADLIINKDTYEVEVHGNKIELSVKEFRLLYILASNPQKIYSREALIQNVWGENYVNKHTGEIYICPRVVDTHICNLKKKIINIYPPFKDFIENTPEVGYRLSPKVIN